MHSEQFWSEVEPYLKTLLPIKFRQVLGKAGINTSHEDEFKQDMSVLVWMQRGKFDPARGSVNTFADRVVSSGAKMFVRERRAQKRGGGRRPVSLDEEVHGGVKSGGTRSDIFRKDTLSLADRGRHLGLGEPDPVGDAGAREDRRAAIRDLPEHLVPTALLLKNGETPASIARLQNRSRRQVQKDVEELRELLAGFRPRDRDE